MNQFRNIGGQESWLLARVQYERIGFHPEKSKFFLQQDVEWYKKKLGLSEGTNNLKAHAPIIEVASDKLRNALRASSQVSSDNETIPTLLFGEEDMICLDGQARIKAAIPELCGPGGDDGFGFVRIVHDIKSDERNEFLHGFHHQIRPDVGRIYQSIRSENLDVEQRKRLESMLKPGQQQGLNTLRKCVRFSYAYNKVTDALPTIAHGFCWGKVREYHATRCEYSFEKYLVGYIFAFWEQVTRQSQSRINGVGGFSMNDIPAEVFARLHGLMPGVSEEDCAEVHSVFSQPKVFGSLSADHRNALKESILETYCMIPSMALFTRHMLVLEKISFCIGDLLGLRGKHVKRGQGCERPLEKVLKELYAGRSGHHEYQIQTMHGWRTTHASFKDRQDLSCRQLWLFVLRHDDPQLVDPDHLAYMAKKLGFHSDTIATRAAKHMSTDHVLNHPTSWATLPAVSIEERRGQKGGRWLEKSGPARKFLYFDVAETIGTEAAQKVQKLETFTPLVELACIYRAFFGNYSSPSPYAKLPHAVGHAVVNTSTEIPPPPQASLDFQLSDEAASIGTGALVHPYFQSGITQPGRRREPNHLEGHSYPQLYDGNDCLSGSPKPNSHNATVSVTENGFSPRESASSHQGPTDPESHDDCSVRSSASSYHSAESEMAHVSLGGTFPPIEYPHIQSESESEQAQLSIDSTLSDRVETHEDRSLARFQSIDRNSRGPETHHRCSVESFSLQPLSDAEAQIDYPSMSNLSPPSPTSRSAQSTSIRDTVDCHEEHQVGFLVAPYHSVKEPTVHDERALRNTCSAPDYNCPVDGPVESAIIYPPLSGGSTAAPSTNSTQESDGDKALHSQGECSAGITTSNGLIVTGPKTNYSVSAGSSIYPSRHDSAVIFYRSLSEPSTSVQTTGPGRASGDNRTADWQGSPPAGINTSNGIITEESEMQRSLSAEIPRSEPNSGSGDKSVMVYPYLSRPSIENPSRRRDTVKSRSDGLNWRNMTRLHQPHKVLPSIERSCPSPTPSSPRHTVRFSRISVKSLLNPVMTSPTQEDVTLRRTRCQSKEENQNTGLTQTDSAAVDKLPTVVHSAKGIQEKLENPTSTAINSNSKGSEQDRIAPAAIKHVASISPQVNQKRGQEIQPESGQAANASAVFKTCRPTEKEKMQQRADKDRLVVEGFCDGYQEHLPASPYLGDDRHYRGSMELFTQEDLSDHEANQEDNGLKTVNITKLSRKAQGSAFVSVPSRAKIDPESASHTISIPNVIGYEDHRQEDRQPNPNVPDRTAVSEQRASKDGRPDKDLFSGGNRLHSPPKTPRTLHGLSESTPTRQEQPDEVIKPESLPPKASPTSGQNSAKSHTGSLYGLEHRPDPERLPQEAEGASKASTQERSDPKFYAPSTPPGSRGRSDNIQNKPLSLPFSPKGWSMSNQSSEGSHTGSLHDLERRPDSRSLPQEAEDTYKTPTLQCSASGSPEPQYHHAPLMSPLSLGGGHQVQEEPLPPLPLSPRNSPTSSEESHTGGSHGLAQTPDPASLPQETDETSESPMQRCSVPNFPTEQRSTPSTPSVSQARGPHVQDTARSPPRTPPQPGLCDKEHPFTSHSESQQPSVQDASNTKEGLGPMGNETASGTSSSPPPPIPSMLGSTQQVQIQLSTSAEQEQPDEIIQPESLPPKISSTNDQSSVKGHPGGSDGLEQRPDPGSLPQETVEISKSPAQECRVPGSPEPQSPHIPPTAPLTQERRHPAQDEPLSPTCTPPQRASCNSNDSPQGPAERQQPSVHDVNDTEDEVWPTVGESTTRRLGSHCRKTRLPTEPAVPSVASTSASTQQVQSQGLSSSAGQEQPDKVIQPGSLPPKISPTSDQSSTEIHPEGSNGLEQRPCPGSLQQEANETSKNSTQECSLPDCAEPQYRQTPPTAPISQERRNHVQNRPTSPTRTPPQRGEYNRKDPLPAQSKKQQPFVQDVSDTEDEVWPTAGEPSSRHPGSHDSGRETKHPAEQAVPLAPSTSNSTVRAQTQGLQGDDGQRPAEKRTCPNEDSTAVKRDHCPAAATKKPDTKKPSISQHIPAKRRPKWCANTSDKRICIPSPVEQRLDNTAAWAMSRHQLLLRRQQHFSKFDTRRLYGLPSGLFPEEPSASAGETFVLPTNDTPTNGDTAFDTVPESHAGHVGTFKPAPPPLPHDIVDDGGIFASESQFSRFQMPYEGLGGVETERHVDTLRVNKPYSVPGGSPQASDGKTPTLAMPLCEPDTMATPRTAQPEPAEHFQSATSTGEPNLDTEYQHPHPLSPDLTGSQDFTSANQAIHDSRSGSSDNLSREGPVSFTATQATTDQDTCADQQSQGDGGAETEASQSNVTGSVPAPPMAQGPPPETSPIVNNSPVTPEASASLVPEIKLSAVLNPEVVPSGLTSANDSKDYAEGSHCGPPNRDANPHGNPKAKSRKRRCSTPESPHGSPSFNSSCNPTQNAPEPNRSDNNYLRGHENLSHQVDNRATGPDGDVDMDGAHTAQSLVKPISSDPTFEETMNKRVCYGINSTSDTQAGTACADMAAKAFEEHSGSGYSLASQPPEAGLHEARYEDQFMHITHEGPTPRLSLTPNQQIPEQIRPQSDERARVKLSKVKRARRIRDWHQSPDGFVFIVELNGGDLECVHRRPKEGRITPLLRHIQQRYKSGKFFSKILRIVELNPNKNGMIPIDQFFQTEEVLVFQRGSHNGANSTELVEKIRQAVEAEAKAASDEKKAASQRAVKHGYYLRSMNRQGGVDLKHSDGVLPKSAKQNHYLTLRNRRKNLNPRGSGAASRGSAKHGHYLRSIRRKRVDIRGSEDNPMFFAH